MRCKNFPCNIPNLFALQTEIILLPQNRIKFFYLFIWCKFSLVWKIFVTVSRSTGNSLGVIDPRLGVHWVIDQMFTNSGKLNRKYISRCFMVVFSSGFYGYVIFRSYFYYFIVQSLNDHSLLDKLLFHKVHRDVSHIS